MSRTTVGMATLSLVLAVATGAVVWQLVQDTPVEVRALAGGARFDIGLFGGNRGSETEGENTPDTSTILYDAGKAEVIQEDNGFTARPIASITKLMTAMVALDYGIPWDEEVTIDPDEYTAGGNVQLFPGERVTVRDLFNASLIGSANNATLAYVHALGIDEAEFVRQMNRKAIELGLEQTTFAGVTGLDPDNISTAYEVAKMAEAAFTQYPDIAAAASRASYTFIIRGSGREHTIDNTNKLVSDRDLKVAGSKTGFLYEAGYCLVVQAAEEDGGRIAVVLGSSSEEEQSVTIQSLLN